MTDRSYRKDVVGTGEGAWLEHYPWRLLWMCGVLRAMAWPAGLRGLLPRFILALVLCCVPACASDAGSFPSLYGRGHDGWASKTSDLKEGVVPGRLILGSGAEGKNLDHSGTDLLTTEEGYQSDSGWSGLERLQGEVYGPSSSRNPAVQRLLNMQPSVECGDDFMTLRVKGGSLLSNLLVAGGDGSLLPLSQLPTHCGYSVKSTWRDLVFTAPYDGCYNLQEGGSHILPLHWLGTPMKMACPHHPAAVPASVTCYPSGMVVKIDGPRAVASKLNMKFKNEWKPLLWVSAQCGYSVVAHPAGLVITAPFSPCGETKDGMHTIEILEGKIKLSCPYSADKQTPDGPKPLPAYPELGAGGPMSPGSAPATGAPWSPGSVYPQPPRPELGTGGPLSPGSVAATGAPWSPGSVHPRPELGAGGPWSPGSVHPRPELGAGGPWSPGSVHPRPELGAGGPWSPGSVHPRPELGTGGPLSPGSVYPQPPRPELGTGGPWSPGSVYPQPPRPELGTGGPWSPGSVPATSAPKPTTNAPEWGIAGLWPPHIVFPQLVKPTPAIGALRPGPKPETRTDALPPLNHTVGYPFPPWSVYARIGSGPQHPPYTFRPTSTQPYLGYSWPSVPFQPAAVTPAPPAGQLHSQSSWWPLSYHQHNHLHLASDGSLTGCSQVAHLPRKSLLSSPHTQLPYQYYNLPHSWSSSRPVKPQFSGPSMQLSAASRQAFRNYWDPVVPFSSSQPSSHNDVSGLASTSQPQSIVAGLQAWPNMYQTGAKPLYPTPQTPRHLVFPYHPLHRLTERYGHHW
ncbi:COPII coat assembly protein sec16-like isoform X1 [Arapaima gigas]